MKVEIKINSYMCNKWPSKLKMKNHFKFIITDKISHDETIKSGIEKWSAVQLIGNKRILWK